MGKVKVRAELYNGQEQIVGIYETCDDAFMAAKESNSCKYMEQKEKKPDNPCKPQRNFLSKFFFHSNILLLLFI